MKIFFTALLLLNRTLSTKC